MHFTNARFLIYTNSSDTVGLFAENSCVSGLFDEDMQALLQILPKILDNWCE